MTDMTMAALPLRKSSVDGEQPTLVRWGARAAVAAPLVGVFSLAAGIPILTDDMSEVGGSGRWVLSTGAALAVLILLAVALVGLHRAQETALSRFGHASALLALVGTMLAAGGAWDTLVTVSYLADVAPAVLDRATDGALLAGYIASYSLFSIGWRASRSPRSARGCSRAARRSRCSWARCWRSCRRRRRCGPWCSRWRWRCGYSAAMSHQ